MSQPDPVAAAEIRVEVGERRGLRVAWIEISNPGRANALDSPLMEAFAEATSSLASDRDLRAVVVTGAGEKAFVGGADIGEMAAIDGPETARAFITRVHRCCEALRDLPVPVIARVNGNVFGAGLELAAACDVRVAADTALFGMPEVRLSIPSVVEAALLPGLIGWGRTRELLLFGETYPVAEARAWGLFERIVPAAALDQTIDGWLDQLALCGPRAVQLQKRLVRRWEDSTTTAAIATGIDALAEAFRGDEAASAMSAFLDRRRADRSAG